MHMLTGRKEVFIYSAPIHPSIQLNDLRLFVKHNIYTTKARCVLYLGHDSDIIRKGEGKKRQGRAGVNREVGYHCWDRYNDDKLACHQSARFIMPSQTSLVPTA